MTYFDHVKCPSCKTAFDPEKIAGRPGEPMACPACGAALGMTDLFGLKDAFAESDDPELSLSDLSPDGGETPVWTEQGGYAPDPLKGEMPLGYQPPHKRRPAAAQEEKPWDKGRGHVVSTKGDGEEGGSALDVMRKLKK